jgi:hypothetical protein
MEFLQVIILPGARAAVEEVLLTLGVEEAEMILLKVVVEGKDAVHREALEEPLGGPLEARLEGPEEVRGVQAEGPMAMRGAPEALVGWRLLQDQLLQDRMTAS